MRLPFLVPMFCLAACQGSSLDGARPASGGHPSELQGRIAGSPRTCISTAANQSVRVLDAATVAYDSGAVIWVNRLLAVCPGLSPYNTTIVERSGAQLCRGDRVRGLEPGGIIPGPSCNLQDWVPYRRP